MTLFDRSALWTPRFFRVPPVGFDLRNSTHIKNISNFAIGIIRMGPSGAVVSRPFRPCKAGFFLADHGKVYHQPFGFDQSYLTCLSLLTAG